jgi:hypothetical protein
MMKNKQTNLRLELAIERLPEKLLGDLGDL